MPLVAAVRRIGILQNIAHSAMQPYLDLMRRVADRVVVLFEGRVIYFGPVAGMDTCTHPHVREFLAMDRVDFTA